MTDLEKPKTTRKKKPPTQTAGVTGIDMLGAMGEKPKPREVVEPKAPRINWHALVKLPSFELFVLEQSGQNVGATASEWVANRRASIGDIDLYEQYATWHKNKGLWLGEDPQGRLI